MMKLLSCILLLGCLQLSAGMSAQGISLSSSNATLPAVFAQIEQQTSFKFIYSSEKILAAAKVSITVQNATLEQVLELCFKDQPLTYVIEEKFVVVKSKELKNGKATPADNDVHGMVRNVKDEPIGGATVMMKGTQHAVPTDNKGAFVITNVPPGAILRISSIGYESQEIIIGNNRVLVIHLETSVNALDEMVIKGYYNTTKRLNTGAVSKITAEEISKQPVSNALAAMEGRMPGVFIQQNTGVPGGAFSVQVRGRNSIASGNQPLYVVDGVPFSSALLGAAAAGGQITFQGNPLNNINVSDIESIEVLKDADATAIYGSRGANGVVLITTKKGKAGKTQLDVNFYSGDGHIPKQMKLLGTSEYLQMRREAFKNDNATPAVTDYDLKLWDTTSYTDWQKELIGGIAHYTDAQASISGGNENTTFILGGGYHRETTVFPGEFADRKASGHFQLNHLSNDKRLRVAVTANYLYDNNNLFRQDLTSFALSLAPNAPPPYDINGNLNWPFSNWQNPLGYLSQKYKGLTNTLVVNSVLSYKITERLQVVVNAGYMNAQVREVSTRPIRFYNPALSNTATGNAVFAYNNINTWILEPQLNYNVKAGPGIIEMLAGASFQEDNQNATTLSGSGYTNDALIENIQAAPAVSILDANMTKYRYNAFFSRINYNIKNKYLVNITGRRDGSSRFGPGRQFANFGAIGTAWIFSNEKNIKSALPFLNYGKLRASYGITGNDQIGDYGYFDTYSPTQYSYQGNQGLYPTGLFNAAYGWETNRKLEIALDLSFLNDRIIFNTSFYRNLSSNQLVGYPLPLITGGSSINYNLGATVQNMGWEFEMQTSIFRKKFFTWVSSANISIPRNKLVSYPGFAASSYVNKYVIGEPLSIVKAYHFTGVDSQTGINTFEDVDKDGKISSPNDLQGLQKVAQNYYGGLLNSFKYKQFQLDFLFQFVKQTARNYLFNTTVFRYPGALGNQPAFVMDRWVNPGDKTDIQKFTQKIGGPAFYGWYYSGLTGDNTISDASYIRLKNVNISYEMPSRIVSKWRISVLKIYVEAQNLLTVTHYKGLDPESQNMSVLPPLRTIIAGFKIIL